MFKLKKQIFFIAVLFLLAMPIVTSAAGLIPCGGKTDPCTLCHLIVGFKGLVDYGMRLIVVVAITGITVAGVMYVISAGDEEMMKKAKGFIKASLMGFAFVFLGWLIVSITMFLFSAKDSNNDKIPDFGIATTGSWNKFTCSTVSTSGQTSGTTNLQNTDSKPQLTSCGNDNAGYCYDGNFIKTCPTGITQVFGGTTDCPKGLYCCAK
ncbi:MAG: pilin [Parcubacteria group bacterium]|jgi:hypothetical protein